MIYLNENQKHEQVDALVKEVLADFDNTAKQKVNENELYVLLGNHYHESLLEDLKANKIQEIALMSFDSKSFIAKITGKELLERVRVIVCKIIPKDKPTREDWIKAIVEALLSLIPGGAVIKVIVEKIAIYFIEKGYEKLCPIKN